MQFIFAKSIVCCHTAIAAMFSRFIPRSIQPLLFRDLVIPKSLRSHSLLPRLLKIRPTRKPHFFQILNLLFLFLCRRKLLLQVIRPV